MKQKGFTLVELLVVMVIIGIITAISIPLVRNIRSGTEEKEYSTYQKSIQYAAKLYVDSYGDDIFGNEDSGCAIISYEELKEKNFLKDIELNDVSCDSDDTYVRVVKINKKYGYAASIGCGKKDENGVVTVTYKLPKENIVSSENCGVDATTIMTFSTDITNPNSLKYKNRSMKVTISSSTGIASNPLIQYGFSATKDGSTISRWGQLTINPESEEKQNKKILQGMTITATSSQISTPDGLTGKYYLILRIDRLRDPHGKNWTSEGNSNYVYLGPYTLDNTKPEFNASTVVSSKAEYNDVIPKLNLKVTDVLATDTSNLKMCISYESDTCRKTKNDFANYETYNANKVLPNKIKESLDGTKHKVFVTVVDPAGNYQTKDFSYELASVITYNGNGNTGGSTAQTICNNNIDCTLRGNGFSKTGYNFVGWYTAATGGTKYGATTKLTKNITVYAHWEPIVYTITYNYDGGTANNPATYTIETNTITLNHPTKTGYTFSGWTGSNGTAIAKTVTIPKGSTGNKTYTAHYTINQYTITYLGNGNTGGSTATTTCNYMETCTLRGNGFSKTGYNYNGWYTAASGGSKYGSTTQLTQNITVYAQWIDNINPTCSTSKVGGVGSEDGVLIQVTCNDAGSQCREATYYYRGQRSSTTYTVYDNAGNSGTCSTSISTFECHPYQYECGRYYCGSYVCGSYVCGSYECGSYACGSYRCGCNYYCGTASCGCNCCADAYCTSYCPSYCTSYCDSYCDFYCTSYCTGYRICYQ